MSICGRIFGTLLATLLLTPIAAQAGAAPPPGGSFLTLINGWKNAPSGTAKASATLYKGIVRLKGAIWTDNSNSSDMPFVLPSKFRPSGLVFVKIDACGASNGRLIINADGTTQVQAESDSSLIKCMTSLDGVTYAAASANYHALKLRHAWQPAGGDARTPSVKLIAGVVRFAGAITGGSDPEVFVLPAPLRPSGLSYVPVDMCGGANGRLVISPSGTVTVESEYAFSYAACFTSLEGAKFGIDSTGYTPLTLINGWVSYGGGTRNPAVRSIGNDVQFQGAMSTGGTNAAPFVLPAGFRPSKKVYVAVDMCDATNGRLAIAPNGTVTVEAESGFGNASCFTSLEGVSFHH
jgi:hypothetical protein